MEDSHKNSTEDNRRPGVLQPPIIMKIDGPEESNDKETEENDKNMQKLKDGEFKMCSPSLKPSLLSSNPFASSQNKVSRGILKPPQFNINSNNVTPPILKPSLLNPFSKNSSVKVNNSEQIENSDTKVNGEMLKFVPLVVPDKTIHNDSKTQSLDPKVSSSSFVFGENLKERVIAAENQELKASTSVESNGTSNMLFSSAIKTELKVDRGDSLTKDKDTKSLSESAKEYEESRAVKRKYEEVEVITGEENETNILNISCKLFSFNKVSSNWLELGRGTLRLNDLCGDYSLGYLGSRLVFRTFGSLRVVLNTKIWPEMVVDKASEKSIRITAVDVNGEIKVFLVMSNIEDTNKLYTHLQNRLEKEIAAQKRKKNDEAAPEKN
ncbi:ran-binding protein 3 isoform X1 [Diorhabda carinulata]|uniref:ran-binding protein 3 isoform X1 n=1 Tax=Diorhabda sublineata TaxID=1163346 RepID=UPI0024E04BF8|nr:ran-binding protein 3 isoform X1 [Diorhabda sublineata]XP_057653298.1 ran-binding protein 3 isoform X1 [Diorhabda carinulata]